MGFPAGALGVFVLAAITDALDGYVARRMKNATPFGAFLDSMADKLLVVAVLTALMDVRVIEGGYTLAAFLILAREIYVAGLREYVGRFKTPVSFYGKLKMILQMVSFTLLLVYWSYPWFYFAYEAGKISLVLAAVLAVFSAFHYTRGALK